MKHIIILFSIFFCSTVVFANPYHSNVVERVRVLDSYDVIQKQVQFDPHLYADPSGFYQVGQNLKVEKQKALEDEVNLLRSQLDILIKILQANNGQLPNPEVPAEPTPPENQGSELDSKVFGIFKSYCARCHNETKKDGDLQLVNGEKLIDLSLSDRVLVHHRSNGVNLDGDSRMPKGAPPLSDDNVEILRQWTVQKAKQEKGE